MDKTNLFEVERMLNFLQTCSTTWHLQVTFMSENLKRVVINDSLTLRPGKLGRELGRIFTLFLQSNVSPNSYNEQKETESPSPQRVSRFQMWSNVSSSLERETGSERETRVEMFLFFKSSSGTVHEDQEEEKLMGDYGCESLSLTVWRKSLIVSCNGFTVIGSNGNIVYRVDSYGRHPQQLILMDGSGQTLLSMRRSKKLGIDRWSVYEGEVNEDGRNTGTRPPICVVSKNNGILPFKPRKDVIAKVNCRRKELYRIEGSYTNRSCKVVDESRNVVAEMKRKMTMLEGVYFGVEVFLLHVLPGFDPALAMALVLLLDQMFS